MKNKKNVKRKKVNKKNEDLKNKKDLLGGLIIIVLLLLVLVTYVMCYDYKKEENNSKELEIIDNSLSVINIYSDYSALKAETKESIDNSKKIIGTYNCKYDDCDIYNNNSLENIYNEKYIMIKENDKVFVYDFKKDKNVSDSYDEILSKFEDNYYIVRKENKYGMISNKGNEVISCNYDEIIMDNIYDNKVQVKNGNLYGVLSVEDGKVLVEVKYEDVNLDSQDHYSVLKNNLWYVIDETGNEITNGYSYTFAFNKGFIALIDNNLYILKYIKESNEKLNENIIPIFDENEFKIEKNGSTIDIEVYNGKSKSNYQYNISRNKLLNK